MSFQRKKVATALAYMMGVGGAIAASGAYAQAQTPDVPTLTRQPAPDIKVEVTGSNIKRVEGEGALPVQVITRSDIDKSGATTVMELLQTISANNSSGAINIANSIGATTFSAQTASLRALGGGRTLVLINGKRIDSFAGEIPGVQGVNLASIPFEAIERVEILKDGASAIYGSDAIGGVINFITRSDYTGAEATAQYGTPTRGGGGDQWSGSGSFGIGDLSKDRYNVFGSVSYQEQKPLDQNKRDFSNTSIIPGIGYYALSSNQFGGFVNELGSTINNGRLGGPGNCGTSQYINQPDTFGVVGCEFNSSATNGVEMIPDDKTWNVFGQGRFQINPDMQAYATALYSRDEVHLIIQPGPISSSVAYGPLNALAATITLQPTSPFYPHQIAADAGIDGTPLGVRYRTFENGYRDTTDTSSNYQIIGGVKGTWSNWDYDLSAHYSDGKTSERLNGGFQQYSLILPLLNSGLVNLFGPNTPDIQQQLRATNFIGDTADTESKNYGVSAKMSSEIYKLPAGPLALAVGFDGRWESFDQNFAQAIQNGDVTGYGGALKPWSESRTIGAVFGELNIPIVKNLEGNVAVRYDHYSDFGSTTNPKFSLRWQPTRTLLFRGSYGTGFLAPSLYELNTPLVGGLTQFFSDPIRCPVTGLVGVDCHQQFTALFGGNANLKPEESEQATVGMVVEPFAGASFSIDYFKINLKNSIVDGINPGVVLGDLNQFGFLVARGPVDPNFPNLPGPIQSLNQTYINLGNQHIQGIDLEARYRAPVQSWGRLTFDINGTYYLRYDTENIDGTYSGNVGTIYGSPNSGVIPRWKHYATLTWDQGPWSATLAQTFQSSYTDAQQDFNGLRTVGSMSLWDLQGTYSGFKNLKLTLGVKNLFDRNPPVSNQDSGFIAGFDPSYYDPRARFVYGSINYKFK